jgi:hypothetical protein
MYALSRLQACELLGDGSLRCCAPALLSLSRLLPLTNICSSNNHNVLLPNGSFRRYLNFPGVFCTLDKKDGCECEILSFQF